MKTGKTGQTYLDFAKYKESVNPEVRERANNWQAAIGLQAVDGLRVSSFLLDLARRNIEGEITIDEVHDLLDKHYQEKRASKCNCKQEDNV
ncbi:MAG: antitoxin VbhA family protein [Bacteroidales bacterium]|nr:antitoxin VbhA family protein [Bacteroidales bacterium]